MFQCISIMIHEHGMDSEPLLSDDAEYDCDGIRGDERCQKRMKFAVIYYSTKS
jgi:nicotinamide riboside kinase